MKYTRFEKARIIGARALQVSLGAPVLLEIPEGMIDPITISQLEFDNVALINLEKGVLINESNGRTAKFEPLPDFLLSILKEGGLVPYTAKRLR